MASRLLAPRALRSFASPALRQTRSFRTGAQLLDAAPAAPAAPLPARKPVGAFRGGLLGFLVGVVGAGSGMYYYVLNDYRVQNELLTEDIYALQGAVQRIEGYVKHLEDKVAKK